MAFFKRKLKALKEGHGWQSFALQKINLYRLSGLKNGDKLSSFNNHSLLQIQTNFLNQWAS